MTKLVAEKKTVVKNVRAVVTVYNQEERPEIAYILKNIEDLDLRRGERENLKRYLSDLGLFDKKADRMTESGQKALHNGIVTVPQSGLYRLSYVRDPVPGVNSQIIDYHPEKPEWKIVNNATRSMAEYRHFEGVEFTSWNKDRTRFRVEFERPEGSSPKVIDTKEMPANVQISGSTGNACSLEIKSDGLSYTDTKYPNFSLESNVSTLVPEYDKSLDAVRVRFCDIKDDKNALHSFKKKNYARLEGKTLIFSTGDDDDRWNVRIEDVGLIPKTESDAEEWVFSLAAEGLNKDIDKCYFGMDYCNDACRELFAKSPFSRAFPGMSLDIFRYGEFLMNSAPSVFSDIQIAEDLCPGNYEVESGDAENLADCAGRPSFSEGDLDAILYCGEDDRTEFKETLFGIDFGEERNSSIFKAMKTIAAFMNADGGDLLIGVSDDGTIKGLDGDYRIVNENGKKGDQDAFRLRFDQEYEKYIGNRFCNTIKMDILSVDGKDVCRIHVARMRSPVHISSQSDNTEKFYVRRTASTVELNGSSLTDYLFSHFEGRY